MKAAAKAPSRGRGAPRAFAMPPPGSTTLGREPGGATAARQAALLRPDAARGAARRPRAPAARRVGPTGPLRRGPVARAARAGARPARGRGRARPRASRAATARRSPRSPSTAATRRRWGRRPRRSPPPTTRERRPSPVAFEEPARLPTRTWCGGPTKDHILESGGSGVALFDYDGDGRLDVYLVTAAELDGDARARSPTATRSIATSAAGGSRTSRRKAGVDAAAWGNGACAGDFDDDGRLDLYVTNWGPNLLFRNRGDGTFEEVAAQGRRRGGRLEHRLRVLRRRRRRRPRPLRRALRRDDLGRRRARRSARSSGATAPASWSVPRACPARPTSSSRTSATGASRKRADGARPRRRRPRLRLRRRRHRLRRRRRRRPVRGQRLEPELPVPQPRRRPLRERGPARRRRGERRGARAGRHGCRRRRLRRRRP